jgi:NAD-dependent SIR2 family protein deacetylase
VVCIEGNKQNLTNGIRSKEQHTKMKRWFASSNRVSIPRITPNLASRILRENGGLTCIITGAGVSTESGIPDYRGPEGRYMQTASKPMTHQEFMGEDWNRKRFWSRAIVGFKSFDKAKPNRSHFSIAGLERNHLLNGLITQNVDRLHHRAGSKHVVELHGRGDMVECMTCGNQKPREEYHKDLIEENRNWLRSIEGKSYTLTADGDAIIDESDVHSFCVLSCDVCAVGVLKPSYVFFGGAVPTHVSEAALDAVTKCKALFLVGSTASTFSCYRLVKAARDQGAYVSVINRGPTRVDELSHSVFDNASCGEFLEQLVKELLPHQYASSPIE